MRTRIGLVLAVTLMTGLLITGQWGFGQGDLTPPGAPAPTMKTLAQVEPRTPISSLPYTITEPGSYYVTTNLTGNPGGINVAASGVTIDLMGFELAGGTGSGIQVSGTRTNLCVRNGTVRGWSSFGVSATLYCTNNLYTDLRLVQNGGTGLYTGPGSTVTRCGAFANGAIGIRANTGSIVRECTAVSNGAEGIYSESASAVSHCSATKNGSDGIRIASALVTDCIAQLNTGDGIQASNDSIIRNNAVRSNGNGGDGAGIHTTGNDNRIESNHVTDNDRGLDIDGSRNIVRDNTVLGNTDNYDIAAGNELNLLLSQVPESIDWPAHVVLAGSLSVTSGDAITIAADNVTLDLGGHTLSSTDGSPDGTAILLSGGRAHIHILNGHIKGSVTQVGGVFSGSGFGDGIYWSGAAARNVRVTGVSVSGCQYNGIRPGGSDDANVVESCTVHTVGGDGIYADTVTGSSAHDCGGAAISATIASNCRGRSIDSYGVYVTAANNCYGYSSNNTGLYASGAANSCYGYSYSSGSTGLYAGTASNCYGYSYGNGTGLAAAAASNCYGYSFGDGDGVDAAAIANSCRGHSNGAGRGVDTEVASNCYGYSISGYGLYASYSAYNCYGRSSSSTGLNSASIAIGCRGFSVSGTGLSATIANSCTGSGTPALDVTNSYNMP